MRKYDVLSRQHLRVERNEGQWVLILLPEARNLTLLDGNTLFAGIAYPLAHVSEVTVDELHMRFVTRGEPKAEPIVEASPDAHPVGLLTLNELLIVLSCNEAARVMFDPPLLAGADFPPCFDLEGSFKLRQALMSMGDNSETEEMELSLASASRWFSMRFRRQGTLFFGAVRDSTPDHLQLQSGHSMEARMHASLDGLEAVLLAPSFRAGDLPASLPLLAQHAASLVEGAAISLWIMQPEGHYRCCAKSGFGHAPLVGKTVEPDMLQAGEGGEIDAGTLKRMKMLGLLSPNTSGALILDFTEGCVIFQRQTPEPWKAAVRKQADVIITLFQQALSNSERASVLQSLQDREAALIAELAEAARYVERLLPRPVASGPIQVEWIHRPCGQLGGDVFGYEWLDEDRFVIYIVDVVGHGIGASLLAVSIVNNIRIGIAGHEPWVEDPSSLLQTLNGKFQMEQQGNLTWTMWCGVFDRTTRLIRYASGGHPPAVLVTSSGFVELSAEGIFLGGMPDASYESERATVPHGAKLFICTDGAYEFPLSDGREGAFSDFARAAGDTWAMATGECVFLHKRAAALCAESEFPDDFTIIRAKFDV